MAETLPGANHNQSDKDEGRDAGYACREGIPIGHLHALPHERSFSSKISDQLDRDCEPANNFRALWKVRSWPDGDLLTVGAGDPLLTPKRTTSRRSGTTDYAVSPSQRQRRCKGRYRGRVHSQICRIVKYFTAVNRGQADNAAWRDSAMTEFAKRRITGDVVILTVGVAILIVLAFLGAL
jgi:hypothetical protein